MGELWDAILLKIKHSDGEDLVAASILLAVFAIGPLLSLVGYFIYEMTKLYMGCS